MALNLRAATFAPAIQTVYFGDVVDLIIDNKNTSVDSSLFTYTIEYSINNQTPVNIVSEYPYTTLNWEVPMDLSQLGKYDTFTSGTLTIYTNYKGNDSVTWVNGTNAVTTTVYFCQDSDVNTGVFVKYLEAYDSNGDTVYLTNNNKNFVKYFSTIYYKAQFLQTKSVIARIREYVGGKQVDLFPNDGINDNNASMPFITTIANSYTKSEGNGVKHTIQTQKGAVVSYNWQCDDFVEYTKLSCNQHSHVFDVSGKVSFIIEGNYFNSTFGSFGQANNLNVYYSYGNSGWINAGTPIISNNNYTCYVTIYPEDFNYQDTLIIRCKAEDMLMSTETAARPIASTPTFDWSMDDFNFNVPVTHQSYVNMKNEKAIYGETPYGSYYEALEPCDSEFNTTLGYGNYDEENGATLIYGNSIHMFAHDQFTLNGENLLGMIKGLTMVKTIKTNNVFFNDDVSDKANWQVLTTNASDFTLRNGIIYGTFNITLSYALDNGLGSSAMPAGGIFCGRVEIDNSSELISHINTGQIAFGSNGSYFTVRNPMIGYYVNPYGQTDRTSFDVYLIDVQDPKEFDFTVDLAIPVAIDYDKV